MAQKGKGFACLMSIHTQKSQKRSKITQKSVKSSLGTSLIPEKGKLAISGKIINLWP